MRNKIILEAVVFLLAVLFIYAGISKLLDHSRFSVQLAKSPMLTDYSRILSWILPLSELVIALLLFTKYLRNFALYAYLFLMVTFTAYLFVILNFSYHVPCSCGGVLQNMSWRSHIIFNIVFVGLNIYAIVRTDKTKTDHYFNVGEVAV